MTYTHTEVTALGTTYNLPNFVGPMYFMTPKVNSLLAAIGGIGGGYEVMSEDVPFQLTGLPTAAQPAIVEGADPALSMQTRQERYNILQIFQEGVKVSYSKLMATGQLGNTGTDTTPAYPVSGSSPIGNEYDWQMDRLVEKVSRDVNFSIIQGTYQRPSDNATGRKMRGLLAAITTHEEAGGAAALTKTMIDNVLLDVWGGNTGLVDPSPMTDPVFWLNGFQKQAFSGIYGYAPEHRNVGGVNINQIETDFGVVGIALDRLLPADDILLLDMSYVRMAHGVIPGKGVFFAEPLAQTGAAIVGQLYGEMCVDYGPEEFHGKITNLATS